jgi:hypothetical protein
MVVFGLAWSVIVSLCIGQTDDESFFPEIRYLRMRPKFPMPTTPHPANLEEAKRWLKEAFYADVEGLLAQRLGKPESVWKRYYRQAAKLARGVYEKFGDFSLVWLVPEEEWAEFGDILLFPKDIWQDYRKMKDWEMKKGEPLFSEPIDPTLLYGLALHREALDKAKKEGQSHPLPSNALHLFSFWHSGERLFGFGGMEGSDEVHRGESGQFALCNGRGNFAGMAKLCPEGLPEGANPDPLASYQRRGDRRGTVAFKGGTRKVSLCPCGGWDGC